MFQNSQKGRSRKKYGDGGGAGQVASNISSFKHFDFTTQLPSILKLRTKNQNRRLKLMSPQCQYVSKKLSFSPLAAGTQEVATATATAPSTSIPSPRLRMDLGLR